MLTSAFGIDPQPIHTGFDGKTCWVHARGGFIPRPGGPPVAIVTMQKLLLTGCDVFYGLHVIRSDDDGHTWTAPAEQSGFGRFRGGDGTEGIVCDFTPAWHAASRTLLGTGHIALYRNNKLVPAPRPRQPVYAVFNEHIGTFGPPQSLELPQPEYSNVGSGSVQRLDLPGGDVLLPVYGKMDEDRHTDAPYTARVLRCAFDGRTMTVRQIGPPVPFDDPYGLVEPSLTCLGGRYYLTLRHKDAGYVAASDDGLTFEPPRPWTFDDRSDLGNYNTQQHWATHGGQLFLVYTRRGLDNDHVFSHRAPLVMAQVDPDRLCVIRQTERVVVPQRGARLGNFSVSDHSEGETWVVVAEWMQNAGPCARTMMEKLGKRSPGDPWTPRPNQDYSVECRTFGSDNTVWASRIRWHA